MVCSSCGQSLEWHQKNNPHHEYTENGGGIRVPPPAKEIPHPTLGGGDVVLRMALLKAGVLTEGHIKQAQLWVEKGAERGHALLVEADPDHPGENRFRLLSFEELASELVRPGGG